MANEDIERAKSALRKKARIGKNRVKRRSIKEAVGELMKEWGKEDGQGEKNIEIPKKESIQKIISEEKEDIAKFKSKLDEPKPLGAKPLPSLESAVSAGQASPVEEEVGGEGEDLADRPYQRKTAKYEGKQARADRAETGGINYVMRPGERDAQGRNAGSADPTKPQYFNKPLQGEAYERIEKRRLEEESANDFSKYYIHQKSSKKEAKA